MLETDGVTFATLGGSQARIVKLLKQFAEGRYRVLFLNARNMGAGLNIAAATHVVLYHKMSVETKNQIIGRAVRMGRTEPLTVLHLLHGNEMLVRGEEGLSGTGNRIQHV
jgi:SNF2 family DNA or RNA helicase